MYISHAKRETGGQDERVKTWLVVGVSSQAFRFLHTANCTLCFLERSPSNRLPTSCKRPVQPSLRFGGKFENMFLLLPSSGGGRVFHLDAALRKFREDAEAGGTPLVEGTGS